MSHLEEMITMIIMIFVVFILRFSFPHCFALSVANCFARYTHQNILCQHRILHADWLSWHYKMQCHLKKKKNQLEAIIVKTCLMTMLSDLSLRAIQIVTRQASTLPFNMMKRDKVSSHVYPLTLNIILWTSCRVWCERSLKRTVVIM